jgi:uncharacterized PurR-regulated membrane protein YhhQ (DUF165 family)
MEYRPFFESVKAFNFVPLMCLSIFFIAAIIGADVLTYKLIYLFGFTASAAIIFFPLTYLISDITVEVYGQKTALWMYPLHIAG